MTVNRTLLATQIVGMLIVFALALFFPAGTLAWPAGWVFLLLFFGFVIALSRWLLKHNPDLLTERMTGVSKADQKAWDEERTLRHELDGYDTYMTQVKYRLIPHVW